MSLINCYVNFQISLPVINVKLEKYQDQFELALLRLILVALGYQEAISFSFSLLDIPEPPQFDVIVQVQTDLDTLLISHQ